jgi:phosphatidylinositol alpha-1,6-mannosyltransferase
VTRHLLVTNDFPPKLGGIQSYLYELWRRLPADSFAVYTTPFDGSATFDANHPFPIERSPESWLGPYPWLVSRINRLVREFGADFVLLDPAVPLGAIGRRLAVPHGVILHGAEVTIPGRLPLSRQLLARVLRSSQLVVAAGQYSLDEAERCAGRRLPSVVIPPGVDGDRFHPYDTADHHRTRASFGVSEDEFLLASVNRLVARKGMDVLIEAASLLRRRGHPVRVLIGGDGRCRTDLQDLIDRTGAPARLLGRVDDEDIPRLYGAADAMAMLCHDRWFGLEQEGFGIVFLEAAAAGIPQVAGRSGGAHEAVEDGVTGFIVDDPRDPHAVADVIEPLVTDRLLRERLGRAARKRAVAEFDYDDLAARLGQAIANVATSPAGR